MRFCIGALNTKLILILGHTNCGAVKGATSQYLKNKGSTPADPCLEAVAVDCGNDQAIRFQVNLEGLVMAQKGRSAWIYVDLMFDPLFTVLTICSRGRILLHQHILSE